MVVALLIVTGVLALLFYVMHLVKPKRVRLSATILKVVEFSVEAESAGSDTKPPGTRRTVHSGRQVKALSEAERKALPEGGEANS
jgi:hypothetical protein